MIDLRSEYLRIKEEIDACLQDVFQRSDYINGTAVKTFCERLSSYLNVPHVIPCGNGTDALRIALQALEAGQNDEVIVPAFSYIAPVEAIASLGASPVMVDVFPETFNINPGLIEKAITKRTKAIIVVHLFGQSCDMAPIQKIALKYNLAIIEDNAQSFGASYLSGNGEEQKTGTIGDIGITSFFPTKPLACYGDGGAIFTSDEKLAKQMHLLANHGQTKKYHHAIVGCNSRLDTMQAAILNVKLDHIDESAQRRRQLAERYKRTLSSCPDIILPIENSFSTHVYHQYTIRIQNGKRDALKDFLANKGVETMIYYPKPIHEQEAYRWLARLSGTLHEALRLSGEVLSLPLHSEMTDQEQNLVIETIGQFFS